MSEIAMFDIRYDIVTAGPSPYGNRRTELYFAGCDKALSGNPCPECFNEMIWTQEHCLRKTPQEFLDCLNRHRIHKYVTIVGGEPTFQREGLSEFGRLAKEDGYHLILFSWHDREWLEKSLGSHIYYFDIIVPGQYMKAFRIYDENKQDGLHNMVGSGNQLIWLPNSDYAVEAADVYSLSLDKDNVLEVTLNNGCKKYFKQ